jgi:hypothetical protein
MIYQDWAEYVHDVLDKHGADANEAGRRMGIHPDGIRRWLRHQNEPLVDKVMKFAAAFNEPVTEAFIAAGYMTPNQAGLPVEVKQSIRDLSDDQLLAEVARRLAERPKPVGPVDEVSRLFPLPEVSGEDS